MMPVRLPAYVLEIIHTLKENGQEAFAVGGCVRDLLMGRPPADYDVATSALPAETMAFFPKTVAVGEKYGTVAVLTGGGTVEVSSYKGVFTAGQSGLKQDLLRRDFTVNAMAMDEQGKIYDPFGGQEDLRQQTIRSPENRSIERFQEDPLRMMRAIRFCVSYGFALHPTLLEATSILHEQITQVSWERIRDEFNRILVSERPVLGMELLLSTGLIQHILPEVMPMVGFNQRNINHDKDVFQHSLAVLAATPPRLNVRLAALLHDIGKPACFTIDEKGVGHFYGHHLEGQKISRNLLQRFKYDSQRIEAVSTLVAEHMSRFAKIRNASLKKLISRVGEDHLQDLYDLQKADIMGSAPPFDFSALETMQNDINRILHEQPPMQVQDLAINGHDLMEIGIAPGLDMGRILNRLLEEVLEDPAKNHPQVLLNLAQTLHRLD